MVSSTAGLFVLRLLHLNHSEHPLVAIVADSEDSTTADILSICVTSEWKLTEERGREKLLTMHVRKVMSEGISDGKSQTGAEWREREGEGIYPTLL